MFLLITKIFLTRICRYRQSLVTLTLFLLFFWISGCSEEPEKLFQSLDQEAKAHFAGSEYDKAVMIWERALAIKPNSPDIYQKIGAAHLWAGDYAMAVEAFHAMKGYHYLMRKHFFAE